MEGEGSGLIALEEISGRAFKGRVRVITASDVQSAAQQAPAEQTGGGRANKRRRRELVLKLETMVEEKGQAVPEESKEGAMDEQQAMDDDDSQVEVEEAGEAVEDDEAAVEFDPAELDAETDQDTSAATLEAQRILGQMRDEDDEDDEDEAEAVEEQTDTTQVKREQMAEDDEEDDAVNLTTQAQPDLSTPPLASAWDEFHLHPLLLHSLHTLGFHTPTPVQAECLPPALIQRRDIIAAAETGSGKTLTFALPILNGLLLSPPADGAAGVVALVLVPTRELALQVAMHVRAAAQYMAWFKCCVLVGGLSQQKQLRQLAAHPHVLIATPGRLCELIVEGAVKGWHTLRYLVLDEADRMVERGLGAEVQKVMTAIDRQRAKVSGDGNIRLSKLQHFFFSATLALPDVGRENLKLSRPSHKKRRRVDGDSTEEEEAGMVVYFRSLCASMVGSRPHVVDLTSDRRLVGGLSEYVVPCVTDDKDYYVYALLLQQPVNTKLILFVNAISCLRRLSSLLSLMELPVYPLHAEMQQRQRLKNLDRFSAATTAAILLCTDVAARGLDLPAVPMVVHYQLPGSSDVYIHRVGRTARAGRVGVSVALLSEEDGRSWHRINTVVRGSSAEEVERWKVDDRLMAVSRERMTVARKLDRLLNRQRQHKHNTDWLQRQAAEMDMIVDDDTLQQSSRRHTAGSGKRGRGGGDEVEAEEAEREEARRLQKQLSGLLKRRMEDEKKHGRFFTLNVVEELERRAEDDKKRLVQAEQEKRMQQKPTAASTRETKPKTAKTTTELEAKPEAATEPTEQSGKAIAITTDGVQQGVKHETVGAEEHKQQNDTAVATKVEAVVRQSAQPTPASMTKQSVEQSKATRAVAQPQTNGHAQPTPPKQSLTENKPSRPIAAEPSNESVKQSAVVGGKSNAESKESSVVSTPVQTGAVDGGEAVGETKKLGKRAKKNLRKQKQKLATTTQPPLQHPHTPQPTL